MIVRKKEKSNKNVENRSIKNKFALFKMSILMRKSKIKHKMGKFSHTKCE